MARRYGGPHSPGGDPRPEAALGVRRRSPLGFRVNFLFVLPFLFAVSAFFHDPAGLVRGLVVFALMFASAWLTREGVRAQAAYESRPVARKPALPRKILGSGAMGLALTLASLAGTGLPLALVLGIFGAILHLLSFGPDPLRDKGLSADRLQAERALRTAAEAEARLAEITTAIATLNDRALDARMRGFVASVLPLIRAVESEPQKLAPVRRYLGLYLEGARDAAVQFAAFYAKTRDNAARDKFLALLDDLEARASERLNNLRELDRQALEIEIDVLRERLLREGLATLPAVPNIPQTPLSPPTSEAKGKNHA